MCAAVHTYVCVICIYAAAELCCVALNCAAGRVVICQYYLAKVADIDAAAVAGCFVCLIRIRAAYSAAAGSLSFIFSDFVLAYAEFIDTFKQSRFVVMVSYILAESLITLSALFLT